MYKSGANPTGFIASRLIRIGTTSVDFYPNNFHIANVVVELYYLQRISGWLAEVKSWSALNHNHTLCVSSC